MNANTDDDYLRQRYREEMEDLRHAIELVTKKKQALESDDKPDDHKIKLYESRLENLQKSVEYVQKKARTDGVNVL